MNTNFALPPILTRPIHYTHEMKHMCGEDLQPEKKSMLEWIQYFMVPFVEHLSGGKGENVFVVLDFSVSKMKNKCLSVCFK